MTSRRSYLSIAEAVKDVNRGGVRIPGAPQFGGNMRIKETNGPMPPQWRKVSSIGWFQLGQALITRHQAAR